MEGTCYIQVFLPLKLEWEPFYQLADAHVGERVAVRFAFAHYIGVVSAVNVQPSADIKSVLPAQKTGLSPIHPREIAFWRSLAQYYLCSVGEVYKAAYPARKQDMESVEVRVHERLEKRLEKLRRQEERAIKDFTREKYRAEAERIEAILAGEVPFFDPAPVSPVNVDIPLGKTVLLQGQDRIPVYLEMARKTLLQGRSVLYLVPGITLSSQLEDRIASVFQDLHVFHSALAEGRKRAVATAVRTQPACFVLGTRSALFLPHQNLGLIIVDDEQDVSYKQTSPAPRYHAREAAILLAREHGAQVILGSATPSLESLYNTETGLFTKVQLKENLGKGPEVQLINTAAEIRKKGMAGNFSLKMLEAVKSTLESGQKILVICRSKAALQECKEELENLYPGNAIDLATPATYKSLSAYALIAVVQADGLLSKEDFRSDEHTLQFLQQLKTRCGQTLIIQTMEAAHPVFKAFRDGLDARAFLEERRMAGYPPFSRLVDVVLRDKNEKRAYKLSLDLADALRPQLPGIIGPYSPFCDDGEFLRCIRIVLPRDKTLLRRKQTISQVITQFEKQFKYVGHIGVDVDPA